MLYRPCRSNTTRHLPQYQCELIVLFFTAQEAQLEYYRSEDRGGRDERTLGRGMKEVQDPSTQRCGAWPDNARGGSGGPRTRSDDQQQSSRRKTNPSGRSTNGSTSSRHQHSEAQRRRERGDCGGRAAGATSAGGMPRPEAPDGSITPRSQRSLKSQSPTSKPINLEKMSGFGPGDRGWSERVENRRQQKLEQRHRASASVVAEVNNDSGKIEPLTPTAPASSFDGHHQAVSPPRLRRLVHAEVRIYLVADWQG